MFYLKAEGVSTKVKRTKVDAKPFSHCRDILNPKKVNPTSNKDQFSLDLSDTNKASLSWLFLIIRLPFQNSEML
jgi:hypothetical protein